MEFLVKRSTSLHSNFLRPAPYTLSPCALRSQPPTLYTLHPNPLPPTPYTLTPYTLHPTGRGVFGEAAHVAGARCTVK